MTVGVPRRHPGLDPLLLLTALAVTGLAYAHIVGNYFWSDDFYYLYMLNDRRLLEFVLTPHGGHVQPFRNLVYALYHWLFGVEAASYYAGVLATHLLNTAMLFVFLRRATASAGIACAGAVLWGASPLNEGSVGWFAVYGHVLVATLLLWVMLRVQAAAGAAPVAGRWSLVAGLEPAAWYAAILLGALSFGTGIGIALVFPLVLTLWLPGPRHRAVRLVFWTLPAVTLALYFQFHRWHQAIAGEIDRATLGTPGLLRQFWWLVPSMTLLLLLYGAAVTATGPLQPFGNTRVSFVAGAIALAAALIAVALRGDAAARRLLAGGLLLSIGAYATIAIGRGPLLFATARVYAEAVTWPRYHYVGSLGIVVAACALLRVLRDWLALPRRTEPALLVTWLALTVVGIVRFPYATVYKVDARAAVAKMKFQVGHLARLSTDPNRVFIDNRAFWVGGYFSRDHRFPGLAAAFIAYFPDDQLSGTRIYFVEDRPGIVDWARRKPWTRTAGLLVTPEERDRLEGKR